jgi:hypothetical protein
MTMTKWGRKETIIWPPHGPIYTYGAVFVAVVLTGLFLYCRFTFGTSLLQRFYTPTYIRSSVAGAIGASRRDNYRMLMVGARGIAPRLATDADVTDGETPEPGGKPIPLALSQLALRRGYALLYQGQNQSYIDATLSAYLKRAVYDGNGFLDLYKLPLLFGLLSLVIQIPFAIGKDVRRRKELRYGRRLKGPEMMTPNEFNKRVGGNGIGIKTDGMKALIRIPERAEAQHMQIIGDTGAGKTTIMLQILRQIKHRGDSAIVYDPAREFVQRFYDPKNGDVILNPLDKRCPYWGPAEELRRRSEAKALAVSLFQSPQDKKVGVFHRVSAKDFRIPHGLRPNSRGVSQVDVRPGGDRPKAERDGACSPDRPEGAPTTSRCSWLAWTSRRQPSSPAEKGRRQWGVVSYGMGRDPAGLDLHHVPPRRT